MSPGGKAGAATRCLLGLSSSQLRVEVDPDCGGKLRSLVSVRSGREFLYQDSREAFDGSQGYSHHDIGGYDECFPTVAACRGRAPSGHPYDYADHGSLWQKAWNAHDGGGALHMTCELAGLDCSFSRTCSLVGDDTLRLDYHLRNGGSRPVPFVYSAHPLLAANEHTRVILPREMTRAYCYLSAPNSGLTDGDWLDLPCPMPADLVGPFSLGRQTFAKLFSDRLQEGRATVEYPDSGERLVITFDTAALPHLGLLAAQGHDSLGDGHFAGEFLLGLEPTTGIGDDLPTCLQTGTLRVLEPGAELGFWICLTVEAM